MLCIDNFRTGVPDRVRHLADNEHFHFLQADITRPVTVHGDVHYIIHAAGIASPPIYRRYPLETIEVNVTGLKNLLELALTKDIRSFLFFSSSEIYGDPSPENIPTPEEYNGNVSCTGPRACYDESKRLGETLAVNYYRQHCLPVKIVRPFNVYGPGLHPEDKRVLPDFLRGAVLEKKIRVLSDGSPTRSFCYIRDGIAGFLAALLSDYNGEAFNIGNNQEISMLELARLVARVAGDVEIVFQQSPEADYLTDNPRRRCPDLAKARTLLGYRPRVSLETGLRRMLEWYRDVYQGGERT